MADGHNKIEITAAELSADAAAKVIADKLAEKPASVVADAPARKAKAPKPAAKPVAPVLAEQAVEPAVEPIAAPPAPAAPPVPAPPVQAAPAEPAPTQSLKDLKDKIMDTTTTTAPTDFTATMRDTAADMQTRAKAAYEKGTELTADVTAFHKGNFDAMVEAGKVLAAGMQELGRTSVEQARTAAETATADVKAMAAVSSPTELFQLQGEIARRNLDAIVAHTSKNAEAMMKLANDMFAPISTRASVAMERFNKAA